MDANEYQRMALRTLNEDLNATQAMDMSVLGLAGETGEFVDLYKKFVYHGQNVPDIEFIKELGDILWYCAIFAASFGYALSEVMQVNVDKLKERYPDQFTLGGGNRENE